MKFDIVAIHDKQTKPNFVFEVKILKAISKRTEDRIVQFRSDLQRLVSEHIGVMFYYCSDIQIQYELDSLIQKDSLLLVTIQIEEELVNSEWMELYQAWFCTYS